MVYVEMDVKDHFIPAPLIMGQDTFLDQVPPSPPIQPGIEDMGHSPLLWGNNTSQCFQ